MVVVTPDYAGKPDVKPAPKIEAKTEAKANDKKTTKSKK